MGGGGKMRARNKLQGKAVAEGETCFQHEISFLVIVL